ncbi:MAG: dethiobiotin synthase [Polyangiales bacterium]
MRSVFVTATGTGVGKTWFSCALTTALVARGERVAAIKPVETGCDPDPLDALALAEACGNLALAHAPGLYRAREPLAPYAVEKRGGPSVGSLDSLVAEIRALGAASDWCVVEGAGGVLVPVDARHTFADLMTRLGLATVLVAPNGLGVLSHTLTAVESLRQRDVDVAAVILNDVLENGSDLSAGSNREVLEDLLPEIPVFPLPHAANVAALATRLTSIVEYLSKRLIEL